MGVRQILASRNEDRKISPHRRGAKPRGPSELGPYKDLEDVRPKAPASEGGRYRDRSDAAEDDVGDFRRGAEADWGAYRADAAVYVEGGEAVGGVGHELDGFALALWLIGHEQRAAIEAGDVIGDEARGAEADVQDFHLHLAAVGVACERKFNAQFRGAIEGVRIVRPKNVGHVSAHKRLEIREHLLLAAAGAAFALVIHAD